MDILPRKSNSPRIVSRKAVPSSSIKPYHAVPATPERSKLRNRFIRFGLLAFNIFIVGIACLIVLINSGSKNVSYGIRGAENSQSSNPLDSLTAADIAVNVAKMTGLPEELAVTNQADVINLYMDAATVENEFVTKALIMSPNYKSKADIVKHIVQQNDTLAKLTTKYGVTSDSIKWSNSLTGDDLTPGDTLYIPPVNGMVYVVGVGDTPDKLAETYKANASEIIAFNDAELKGLILGDRIVIPDGIKPRPILAYKANYGYNGYWYGYCTWYVATKISMPNNWRDANQWDDYARVTPGWIVGSTPVVGAIAQTNAGAEGHV
ncbi:MAG: LysM peptidoglycan-binding domain-containing protein, partial [bacterium]|nr:LysM peptidoglycan-binding domain-containing protein [bacterium]